MPGKKAHQAPPSFGLDFRLASRLGRRDGAKYPRVSVFFGPTLFPRRRSALGAMIDERAIALI